MDHANLDDRIHAFFENLVETTARRCCELRDGEGAVKGGQRLLDNELQLDPAYELGQTSQTPFCQIIVSRVVHGHRVAAQQRHNVGNYGTCTHIVLDHGVVPLLLVRALLRKHDYLHLKFGKYANDEVHAMRSSLGQREKVFKSAWPLPRILKFDAKRQNSHNRIHDE
jgi:hypothetical protein